jgi:hypothetical protein
MSFFRMVNFRNRFANRVHGSLLVKRSYIPVSDSICEIIAKDFFSSCEAEDAALLTQGKDDNEAGWKKDKQEIANVIARWYILAPTCG